MQQVVVLHEELLVPGVVSGAFGLEPLDLRQHDLIHGGHQDVVGIGVVEPCARHHVGDHQALEVLLVMYGVLHREDPAPRLPEQHEVTAVQTQRLANLMFASDLSAANQLKKNGGGGYAKTVTVFAPKLRAAGVSDEVLHGILVDNPRRFLAFVPKKKRKG